MKTKILLLSLIFILSGCYDIIPVTTNPEYFKRAAKGLDQAKQLSDQAKKLADQYDAEGLLDGQPAATSSNKYYKVLKVVDGDTIDVDMDGKTERIRFIGVNTPEAVDPRKPVECFGKEASGKANELLAGKEVLLEADPSQTDRDKYNRLLRYARTKEGLFYNLEIIKLGYAYEYTYDLPYEFQKEFKSAQAEAKNNKVGLWAEGVCNAKNVK